MKTKKVFKKIFRFLLTSVFICLGFFVTLNTVNANVLAPGNISTCGELAVGGTYTLTADISTASTTCFTVTADSVTIDGGGFTVTYNAGGTSTGYGIDDATVGNTTHDFIGLSISNITFTNYLGDVSPRTLYFNNASDTLFSNLYNWWDDSGATILAGELPDWSRDQMIVIGVQSYSTDDVTVSGTATLTYTGESYVETSTITGNVTFNDSSYNNGTVTGNATFNGNSFNASIVEGNATFNAPSYSTIATPWAERTSSGSRTWQSITSSSDGTKLVAVVQGGYIYTSTDSGATWVVRTPAGSRNWYSITSSSDGTKLAAGVNGGYIYTSTDSGATWATSTSAGSRGWTSITSSSNGTKLAAAIIGYVYTSIDSGSTWTPHAIAGSPNLWSITSSDDGTNLAAVAYNGYIYTSTDSGTTWTARTSAGFRNWRSITSSSDGANLAAVVDYGGYIYTSADYGVTWTERTSAGARRWRSITSSSNGVKLAAVDGFDGYIYTSADSGATWNMQTSSGLRYWHSITSSSDGTKLAAVNYNNGYIYTSTEDSSEPVTVNGYLRTGIIIYSNPQQGTVNGTITFTGENVTFTLDGGSSPESWTIDTSGWIFSDGTPTWVFNGSSYNDYSGILNGNATFNNSSYNYGTISGDATFNDSSYNSDGAVSGNATFNDSSFNGSSITGNAEFNGSSYNSGTVGGDATFNAPSYSTLATPWTERTSAGLRYWQSITSSSDGTKLAAGLFPGYIYTSADSGATWATSTSAGSRTWQSITSSSDGTKLAAVVQGGYIYTSTDSGATWATSTSAGSRGWSSITSSSDGTKLAAGAYNGYIYTSTDSGITWNAQTSAGSRYWHSITSSSDGTKLAVIAGSYIYTSADSGVTWTGHTFAGSRNWLSITSSSDGTKLAVVEPDGYIYTSADSGANWTERTSAGSRTWQSITSSSDGTKLAAGAYNGYIYTSTDSGITWNAQTSAESRYWHSITSSSDGTKLAAGLYNGYIYTSTEDSSQPVTVNGYLTGATGYSNPQQGTVNGTVTFTGENVTFTLDGGSSPESWTTDTSSWVFSNGTPTWVFNGSSYNDYSGILNGNATFNNSSYNYGTISGDATFNDSSSNWSTVEGDATFTNTAYSTAATGWYDPQSGTVNGTVTFTGENVTFTIADGEYWDVDTSGWVFSNGTPAWVFNGSSYNSSTLIGNATFNDSSYNVGTVSLDATFNGDSYNGNEVYGNATFNDSSYNNYGTVSGDNVVFNDNSSLLSLDNVFSDIQIFGNVTASGNFTVNNLTIENGGTLNQNNDITVTGNWTNNGTLNSNGIIVLSGSGFMNGGQDFENLTISGSYSGAPTVNNTLIISGYFTLDGDLNTSVLSIDGGSLYQNGYDIYATGDWSNGGTFYADGEVYLSGGGSITNGEFDSLNISGSYSTSDDLYISNLTLTSEASLSCTNVYVYGNLSAEGTFECTNTYLDGSGILSGSAVFPHLIFGGPASYTLGSDINVTDFEMILGTTVNASSYDIYTNIWRGYDGSFIPNSQTVFLTGANPYIYGTNTFYNLSKIATESSILTIEAGSELTIDGLLTLKGGGSGGLTVNSSDSGNSQFTFYFSGGTTHDFDYLQIGDAYIDGAILDESANVNVTDGGNNNNIIFATTVLPIITLTGESTIHLAIGATWTEPGYDVTPGSYPVSNPVVISGWDYSTVVPGTFLLYYDVTDDNNIPAEQVVRTVIVDAPVIPAPTITLIGASTINLKTGDDYVEPGYTATDGEGQDVTGSVVVSGWDGSTLIAGTYTIDYSVTDVHGTGTATRTIIVSVPEVILLPPISPIQAVAFRTPPQPTLPSFGITRAGATYVGNLLEGTKSPGQLVLKPIDTWGQFDFTSALSSFFKVSLPANVPKETYAALGVNNFSDLTTLSLKGKLSLPKLGDVMGKNITFADSATNSALNTPVAKLTKNNVDKIPDNIIFGRTVDEKIDLNLELTLAEDGTVRQVLNSTSGQKVKFIIKPGLPAESVTGYIAYYPKDVFGVKMKPAYLPSLVASIAMSNPSSLALDKTVPDKRLIIETFTYTDLDKDGIYEAIITMPQVSGQYQIKSVIEPKDKKMTSKEIEVVTVIDPEGYVFEKIGDQELHLKDAKVSIYTVDKKTNLSKLWDAGAFQQKNPQVTDKTGRYSFLVPEGSYYITAERSGYKLFKGAVFDVVSGTSVHQNIEMKKVSLLKQVWNFFWRW